MVSYKVPETFCCSHECSYEQAKLQAKIKALKIKEIFHKQELRDLNNIIHKLRYRVRELTINQKKEN